MSIDLVYIKQFNTGFDTYDQPEVLPDDGFPDIQDTFCFRGVLIKRDGFRLLGNAGILISNITQANPGQVTTVTNHGLINGDIVVLNDVLGMTQINGIPLTITVVDPTNFTVGIDTTGFGAYISGGFVGMPIMGLPNRITSNFLEDLIAFNMRKAFLFNSATNTFDDISGATSWTGNDSQFFWPMNYFGSFWATNNVDPIRYYITGTTWTNYNPILDGAGTTLQTCLLIFEYKDRIVALNTVEGAGLTRFPQRARFSQNGNPYVTAPVPAFVIAPDVDAWRQDIVGRGGFIDAPTSEKIITAGFVRDTLVVMFERSAWRLRYTGNEILPFIWERINSQLGAESTYSAVGFDEGMLSVGRWGITMTDTNSCARIDQIIPDQVFEFENDNNGQRRVNGIRDYQRQLVYWNYADTLQTETIYPNKVLVFNYVDKSWAVFNQSFTCYGQYREDDDLVWSTTFTEWQEEDSLWVSGDLQAGFPTVVAGNQFGRVFLLEYRITTDDNTPFNFRTVTKKFNPYIQEGLQCKVIYMDLLLAGTSDGEFTLEHYINEDLTTPIETRTVITATNTGQDKVWRRVPLNGTAQFHQFVFKFSNDQMADPEIPKEDLEIYQIILYTTRAGRLNFGEIDP